MNQLGALSNGLVDLGRGTQAAAVNNRGQVVGSSLNSKARVVLFWENGKITDLNDLIDAENGLVLTQATAINNSGQTVVEQQALDRPPKAFLLTP